MTSIRAVVDTKLAGFEDAAKRLSGVVLQRFVHDGPVQPGREIAAGEIGRFAAIPRPEKKLLGLPRRVSRGAPRRDRCQARSLTNRRQGALVHRQGSEAKS